jgi:methionyl-tRNA synthetase
MSISKRFLFDNEVVLRCPKCNYIMTEFCDRCPNCKLDFNVEADKLNKKMSPLRQVKTMLLSYESELYLKTIDEAHIEIQQIISQLDEMINQ